MNITGTNAIVVAARKINLKRRHLIFTAHLSDVFSEFLPVRRTVVFFNMDPNGLTNEQRNSCTGYPGSRDGIYSPVSKKCLAEIATDHESPSSPYPY